jgi:hypothetical protein
MKDIERTVDMGEVTWIRIAKIAAILYVDPIWIALLDGGHRVCITEKEANEFVAILESANASDGNFFARGG